MKQHRKEIAQETIRITEQGWYKKDGKKIDLGYEYEYPIDSVIPLSPDKLDEFDVYEDEIEDYDYGNKGTDFFLIDADSLEAAEDQDLPLVMNFANAYRPGGGFLNGALAQEECLCRNSTLYASISSDRAKAMYKYNREIDSPVSSDYMLLSPFVKVFRDADMELLEEPYEVSVLTIAAPNRARDAKDVPEDELRKVMKDRLRKFLSFAGSYGYHTLVLGAWGCGAFGNDTRTVAEIFDELFTEGYGEFFRTIIFAIYHDPEKIKIFKDVMGDNIMDCSIGEMLEYQEDMYDDEEDDEDIFDYDLMEDTIDPYYETIRYDMPRCNHIEGYGPENKGYTQGIIEEGVPFEAELTDDGRYRNVTFYLPEILGVEYLMETPGSNTVPFDKTENQVDYSILDNGMVDQGVETDILMIQAYVDYLISHKLIVYVSDVFNGFMQYRVDVEGHNIVKIIITLTEKERIHAFTDLNFRPFIRDREESEANGRSADIIDMSKYR